MNDSDSHVFMVSDRFYVADAHTSIASIENGDLSISPWRRDEL